MELCNPLYDQATLNNNARHHISSHFQNFWANIGIRSYGMLCSKIQFVLYFGIESTKVALRQKLQFGTGHLCCVLFFQCAASYIRCFHAALGHTNPILLLWGVYDFSISHVQIISPVVHKFVTPNKCIYAFKQQTGHRSWLTALYFAIEIKGGYCTWVVL